MKKTVFMGFALGQALTFCGPEPSEQDALRRAKPSGEALSPEVCAEHAAWHAQARQLAATELRDFLTALNGARADARLSKDASHILCQPQLQLMSMRHADYLEEHSAQAALSPHTEEAGLAFFSGRTLGERAAAAGLDHADHWIGEGTGGEGRASAVLQTHLATVLHRSQLLAPGLAFAAFAPGPVPVLATLVRAESRASSPLVYPGVSAVGVPRSFARGRELPDPVPESAAPGIPISVHAPRQWSGAREEPSLVVERFELRTASGQVVASTLLTASGQAVSANAEGIVVRRAGVYPSEAFLVPHAELLSARTYRVHFRASYGRQLIAHDWEFTTE